MFYTVRDEKKSKHSQYAFTIILNPNVERGNRVVLVAPLALAQRGLGLSSFCSHSAIIIVHQYEVVLVRD
jgi:hypothetical protein